MALLTIDNLSVAFGAAPLLDGIRCQLQPGDRVALVGRNGAGKTTLLRLVSGEMKPDSGELRLANGAKVAVLPQDIPSDIHGLIAAVVEAGMNHEPDTWQREHATEQILSRMKLDPAADFALLSSGMKRRVLLARALVAEPDLLLLDEPTNHLDLAAIEWLENYLGRWGGTLLFVTHDRMFLRRLATRIFEIDRGKLFDWSCGYDQFLTRREAQFAAQEKQEAAFDKKLAEEEVWIRRGVKARRTRNEGRVRALEAMRRERQQRRGAVKDVRLNISEGDRSGKLVAELRGVSFAYDDKRLVDDFSTKILRGDKVGILGPNGVGKTTLLRLILGQLEPQSGEVLLGTRLRIAYFDQLRQQLDPKQTVVEAVGEGSDFVGEGDASRHIVGYLQDFLFSPERSRTPIRYLSGGERNRVLLARLFRHACNVIVLDEPTNDLDAETLELLEQRLVPFEGAVLVVSHDREFLNNVVTSTIVFEETGAKEYVGGYDDWLDQRPKAADVVIREAASKAPALPEPPTKKLSYMDQRELDALPLRIEQLEASIAALHAEIAKPEFYERDRAEVTKETARLSELESELEVAYERWAELDV